MALQFHNVKGSKFFTRDPYCFRSSLRVPSAGSRLAKGQKFQGLELQGSRAPWLQDSKVAGFHGQKLQSSRNPRLQVSTVSKLSELRVPGFQSRNPLLEPLQEFLAGSLAGTFPDAITKLADLVWVLFYVVLLCFISLHFSLLNVQSCFMCH